MSYTPINWQTGDTITAEKMNKMDNGWSVDSSSTVFLNETVTTEKEPGYPDDPAWGEFQYSEQITAETVVITFDSVEYTCAAITAESGDTVYGGFAEDEPDFSTYPFTVFSGLYANEIATQNDGTHTVKIEAQLKTVEISEDFSEACNTCVDTSTLPMICIGGQTTAGEMIPAMKAGRLLYFYPYGQIEPNVCIISLIDFANNIVSFIPSLQGVSAGFDSNGIFKVTISM